ncbi:hydrogenase maturation protease [Leptolyngbya sp. CCY15150]|uniref:hydrogenase maturation protease n=1 Tax=Leptolyngbya sp. CCY15150 TaxID=2767772 RepID=UPI0019516ADE|nr:hydrogenase maturation protease [Leptolyngbya sp. CCY15150]
MLTRQGLSIVETQKRSLVELESTYVRSDRPLDLKPTAILIIGYGNTLRGDDGAGYYIAEQMADQIATHAWTGVRSLSVHQLLPELAAEIADAQTVIFVDAAMPGELLTQPRLERLVAKATAPTLGHHLDMRLLLDLARQLYGATPTAYRLLIPTQTFDIGITVSPLTQAAIAQAMSTLLEFVTHSIETEASL